MSPSGVALFLCLTLLFSFARSEEDSCSKKDFTSQLGPVRDQGETGWCFAYTAADMLTQKLRKEDPRTWAQSQVSALDMTFQYMKNHPSTFTIPRTDSAYWGQKILSREEQKKKEKNIDINKNPVLDHFKGGFIDLAILSYPDNTLGVCTEKDLPSHKGMTQELISAVNSKHLEKARECGPRSTQTRDIASIRNECWAEVIEQKCRRVKSGMIKRVESKDGWVYNVKSQPDGTFQFATEANGNFIDSTETVRAELKKTLNDGLNKGSIVGIGISPAFLMNEKTKKRMLGEHARHEVSIVGRMKKSGQCYYKIRNSWGKSCHLYSRQLKKRCSNGHIWVTEKELLPNMTRAHYLE